MEKLAKTVLNGVIVFKSRVAAELLNEYNRGNATVESLYKAADASDAVTDYEERRLTNAIVHMIYMSVYGEESEYTPRGIVHEVADAVDGFYRIEAANAHKSIRHQVLARGHKEVQAIYQGWF